LRTLIVGPHPDDELIGCGGTLLRRKAEGVTLGWLLMTSASSKHGWNSEKIAKRNLEIETVRKGLGVNLDHFYQLSYPTTELDQIPRNALVASVSEVFKDFQPNEVLLPHPGDAHSDHKITFEVAASCTKWFRYPSVKKVLVYETISETDASVDKKYFFKPNLFIDIAEFSKLKMDLLKIYKSEIGLFPFPRSEVAINALEKVRGAESGFTAAEAFELLRERN
jgi:LmbE family N-acetylglucosaminyl deacetylase